MKALLALLGASTEAEGIEAVHALNQFLSDTRAATGAEDTAGALNAIQGGSAMMRQLEAVTGKKGQEAINQISEWKGSAENASALAGQVATLEADKAKSELESTIAQLSADGKLPPSLHEWARQKKSKEELLQDVEAWNATHGAPAASADGGVTAGTTTGSKPGATTAGGSGGDAVLSADELEACTALGIEPAKFLERKKFEANATDRQAVNIQAGASN